jgi:hypothetical protein
MKSGNGALGIGHWALGIVSQEIGTYAQLLNVRSQCSPYYYWFRKS